jgi:hypothetical protein
MRTKKYIKQYLLMAFIGFFMASCFDNVPSINDLPQPPVAFTYEIVDENYQIDFYVYATVQFTNTSSLNGAATWNFGDGTTASGNVVTHNFQKAGLYHVELTIDGESIRRPIMINDIVPILSLAPSEHPDGIFEVLNTPVTIIARVPQPVPGMTAEYTWFFPAGTTDASGNEITTFIGENPFEQGGVTFSSVGSQQVRVEVSLQVGDGEPRDLEPGIINVQIALDEIAPTLYIAVRNSNVLALKIPENPTPAIAAIGTYNMGVNSGRMPFNILFHEPTDELFLLDAGARFTFQSVPGDGAGNTGGDGGIRVMSADGNTVASVMRNTGHAFNDPFFGYIHGESLFYTDRNTGIIEIPLNTRDMVSNYSMNALPRMVANDRTCYNGRGISFGAVNSGLFRMGDVWWWGKNTFNSTFGVFRFRDSDIRGYVGPASCDAPSAGAILPGVPIRGLMYDDINQLVYFTVLGPATSSGVYRATVAQLEAVTGLAGLAPYRLAMVNGQNLTTINQDGGIEGANAPFEMIGIPQLALDRATGNVYFGYRSGNPNLKSGLMRINASLPGNNVVEYVIEGIEGITGVSINNTQRKLF